MPSQAVSAAVASTARIDPEALPAFSGEHCMSSYADEAQAELLEELHKVADVRLEERSQHPHQRVLFNMRAAWQERGGICSAIVGVRPWAFPLHFSRLTTAVIAAVTLGMATTYVLPFWSDTGARLCLF